jgi:enterochelin esterase-like enzyme/outer membrane protein assembly factor BamB
MVSLFAMASSSELGGENDWPQWRGQKHNAVATVSDVFKFDEGYGLKPAWQKPLGSGYSSISVADNRVVTMYSDSTFDYMIAFDAHRGDELWRYRFDSTYVGHDGSHNGPISSPLISGDNVYGLGARGHFFALDVATGKEVWTHHLIEDSLGQKPWYGFSTSPTIEGDVVILETGGKGKTISGFDKNTSEVLWSTGNDTISYESPMTIDLAGRRQLICLGDKYLFGLEPGSDKVLWEYRHGGGWINSTLVQVADNRLFLHNKWDETVLLEVKPEADTYTVEEVWKSKGIKSTYSPPVFYNGHLYGYNRRFLTCVDAESGETIWKSRQPGDGFLIVVDGHLVIVTKKGSFHVAKASPNGYEELANLRLFDQVSWTPPSFANGSIYARSLEEIARIDIVKTASSFLTAEETVAPNSKFAQFVRKVEKAEDKAALVDQFMASQTSFPVVEGSDLVHFIYRGEAEDMGITGDMMGDRREDPMRRVKGTDLFYYSTYLEPDAKIAYRFKRNLEETLTDTLNSEKTPSIGGEKSLVAMPGWQAPKHLQDPLGSRGTIDTVRFESKIIESDRKLDIYLPAGYDDSAARYPVAYVHWGNLAQSWGKTQNTLDNSIGSSVAPVIVVFISQLQEKRGQEYTGGLKDQYSQMLAEELIPFIDENYRTVASPEARANIGAWTAGYIAFYSTLKHPGLFGKVSGQTPFLLEFAANQLTPFIKTAAEQPLDVYVDWTKYDNRCTYEGWDFGRFSREFSQLLRERGYKPAGGEANEGFGWAFFRNRTDRIFEHFFPNEQTME